MSNNNTSENKQPEWISKIIQRQIQLNRQYEDAHALFVEAYNEFLMAIDDINQEAGTEFSFDNAVREFKGELASDYEPVMDED